MKAPSRFRVVMVVVFGAMVGIAVLSNLNILLEPKWQTYTAPDGSFRATLPGKPSVEAQQVPAESGLTLVMNSATVQLRNGTTYICAYTDVPGASEGAPEKVLESTRDGILRNVQGTLVKQRRMSVQGYPALEMQARTPGGLLLDARGIVAGKRIYLIQVGGMEHDREAQSIQRMFDSFTILNP